MIPPLIYLSSGRRRRARGHDWRADAGQFVAYYLVLILVNQVTYAQTNWTVGDMIRYGQMNRVLLRPLSPLFNALPRRSRAKWSTWSLSSRSSALLALVLRPELHVRCETGWRSSRRWRWPGCCVSSGATGWRCWPSGPRAPMRCWRCRMRWSSAGGAGGAGRAAARLRCRRRPACCPSATWSAFPVEVLTGQLDAGGVLAGFAIQAAWLMVALGLYRGPVARGTAALLGGGRLRCMRYLRLIPVSCALRSRKKLAYRANFFIGLLHLAAQPGHRRAGLTVLFGQVEAVHGWSFAATLALLGVYLIVGALRGLFIGPSLETLAGMDGEIWSGPFDFTLLRPVQHAVPGQLPQVAAVRADRPGAGAGRAGRGRRAAGSGRRSAPGRRCAFVLALLAGVMILYAILLAFTALVFWSPGLLFTWVFDGVFQMARYPVACIRAGCGSC